MKIVKETEVITEETKEDIENEDKKSTKVKKPIAKKKVAKP